MALSLFFLYKKQTKNQKSKKVNSELVVDVKASEISIALLEDKRLVEINQEGREEQFAVGNIYMGRVKKIMPGLNAAFVDVGYEKDAFLHYLDLGSNFNTLTQFTTQALSDRKKTPAIQKTKLQPEIEKNGTSASPATALARRVLPVPGGPTRRAPFGMEAPISLYFSGL